MIRILTPATPEQFFYNWWLFPLPLLVALSAVFLPGLAIGSLIGLRNKWLWAWAPAVSVTIACVTAIVAGETGITWGFFPLLAATLLILLICWIGKLTRKKLFSNSDDFQIEKSEDALVTTWNKYRIPAAFLTVFILATIWFATVVKLPGAFAQSWDNAFHLNLAMMFTQNGNASTLATNLVGTDPSGYYPAAWHGLVSLIASTCSRSVVVATNALTVVVAFLVWPLSIYTFTSEITRNKLANTLSIPLSLAFPQFPMGFVGYGTLYPNLLGYAFIPLCAALLINCLRNWPQHLLFRFTLLLIAALGAAFSHPNSIFVIAIFFVVILWWFTLRAILHKLIYAGQSRIVRTLFILGWSILWFAIYVAWDRCCYFISFIHAMRGPEAGNFNPVPGTYPQAILHLLLFSGSISFNKYFQYSHLLVLPFTLLVWLGVFSSFRNPRKWLLMFLWIPLAFYYLVVTGMQDVGMRRYLVGVWYNDSPRVFAPLVFIAVPLSAIGTAWLISFALGRIAPLRTIRITERSLALCSLCVTLFSFWGPLSLKSTGPWISSYFNIPQPTQNSELLVDSDELKLFFSLPQYVSKNETIIANPWEGGTFAWAIGERRTVFPKISADIYPPDLDLLAKSLHSQSDPQICKKIKGLNSHYLLELRDQYLWGGSGWGAEKQYPALDAIDLDSSKLVKQVGQAKLLRYQGCQ